MPSTACFGQVRMRGLWKLRQCNAGSFRARRITTATGDRRRRPALSVEDDRRAWRIVRPAVSMAGLAGRRPFPRETAKAGREVAAG